MERLSYESLDQKSSALATTLKTDLKMWYALGLLIALIYMFCITVLYVIATLLWSHYFILFGTVYDDNVVNKHLFVSSSSSSFFFVLLSSSLLLSAGDRLLLVFPPCLDFITSFYACLKVSVGVVFKETSTLAFIYFYKVLSCLFASIHLFILRI